MPGEQWQRQIPMQHHDHEPLRERPQNQIWEHGHQELHALVLVLIQTPTEQQLLSSRSSRSCSFARGLRRMCDCDWSAPEHLYCAVLRSGMRASASGVTVSSGYRHRTGRFFGNIEACSADKGLPSRLHLGPTHEGFEGRVGGPGGPQRGHLRRTDAGIPFH